MDEIRQKIKTLVKEKKFLEALPLFEELWRCEKNLLNEWDFWGYSKALKESGDISKSIKIAQDGVSLFPDFDLLKKHYAWALYYSLKQSNAKDILEKINTIAEITSIEDKHAPYVVSVFKGIDLLKEHLDENANVILELLNRLDPDILEDKPVTLKSGMEIASYKEKYYMTKIKVLYCLKHYENCIKACDNALNSLKNLHYKNNIWFNWKKALCLKELSLYEKALSILTDISIKNDEWFVEKEIAEIYLLQHQHDNAYKHALKGLTMKSELDKKINLISLFGEILIQKNELDMAKMHLLAVKFIKEKNNWSLGEKLRHYIEAYSLNNEKVDENMLSQLKHLWKELNANSSEMLTGSVATILPGGKAGFIKSNNGTYYFKIDNNISSINIGDKVRFILEDGFDKKKNKPSKVAVNITKIN